MVTRADICQAFWPELPLDQAVNVFHVTKRRLHKALGFDVLVHEGGHYRVNPALNEAGIPFTGHTEFLAALCQQPLTVMMLATEGLRVALVTTHLPLAEDEERGRLRERRDAMLRLGVAGLGMMQVMMYAVGLYAGDYFGIEETEQRFLEWVSLLVTLPVLLYSGRIFFEGAWRSLRYFEVPASERRERAAVTDRTT